MYLHGKVDHMDIHSVLKAFDDSLVKLPDSEELYFNYMDYVRISKDVKNAKSTGVSAFETLFETPKPCISAF